jgi:hypothetical protein
MEQKGKNHGSREGDGGTYLVVADDSDEFRTALRYACGVVKKQRGRLGILRIIEMQDFQQWGAVEDKMKRELREQGEQFLWNIAKIVNDTSEIMPCLYFAEGDPTDALIKTLNSDENIVQLILGNGPHGAGPLVSYCIGRGLEKLRIPLVIVPSHLAESM